MTSRRVSGGRFDFVDEPDEEERRILQEKFGRNAPPMGTRRSNRDFGSYERQAVFNKPVTGKIEGFFRRIKNWLWTRSRHYHFRSHQALKNLIGFSALLILALAVYANVGSLNEKPFLFLRIGSTVLIVLVIGSLVFLKRLLVNLKYGYAGSRNAIKVIFFLLLFVLAVGIYFNQTIVFSELKQQYEGVNLGKFNPFVFSYGEIGSSVESFVGDAGELVISPCPSGYELLDENCVSIYLTGMSKKEFVYVLRGKKGKISLTVYKGLDEYLASKPRTYTCPPDCSQDDFDLKQVFEPQQAGELDNLVELIKEETSVKDDRARIAMSLVQQIPYDYVGAETDNLTAKYPYEVLYTKTGVCGEKAKLMAYLLQELGYGVILMDYGLSHEAVGLSCPKEYSVNNSGYCFIEAAAPSIPTDLEGDYIGLGELPKTPSRTVKISDGASLDSIKEEYEDAQEWNRLLGMGTVLPQLQYNRWNSLVNKYGLEIGA